MFLKSAKAPQIGPSIALTTVTIAVAMEKYAVALSDEIWPGSVPIAMLLNK